MTKAMGTKTEKGKAGEAKAERFLTDNGYLVIARNYRYKRSEIDLIVQKENWLVFVEVKLRTSKTFGFPEESVNAAKRKKILEGASQYLHETNWTGNVRYDIVAIHNNEIEHFEDAFY
jgi:putative endonuclease